MKELTIEGKAKRYDEALEKAKIWQEHLNESGDKDYAEELSYIFPKLKESEDEKIRKALIRFHKSTIKVDGIKGEDIIAWLEKQGEQKQDVNVQINPSEYINNIGGNGCYLKNATQTSTCSKKEEKVDNQNCVKSIYDVKPKFKVGDWVVFDNGNVEHITSVGTHGYTFDDGDYLLHDECNKIAHLWSIQDAKDGDVLVSRSPFIYGKQCPYGGLNWCNNKFIKASNFIFTDSPVHPATKEQRDFLFQKMKEAGYTFDFKNKELKKIKNDIEIPFGAKDSELQEATYYIPKGFHVEIDDDKVVIKKGEKPAEWSEDDERIKKRLINLVNEIYNNTNYITFLEHKELFAWLEKLDDNVEL